MDPFYPKDEAIKRQDCKSKDQVEEINERSEQAKEVKSMFCPHCKEENVKIWHMIVLFAVMFLAFFMAHIYIVSYITKSMEARCDKRIN